MAIYNTIGTIPLIYQLYNESIKQAWFATDAIIFSNTPIYI